MEKSLNKLKYKKEAQHADRQRSTADFKAVRAGRP